MCLIIANRLYILGISSMALMVGGGCTCIGWSEAGYELWGIVALL